MRRKRSPLRLQLVQGALAATCTFGCGACSEGAGAATAPPVPASLDGFDERVVERVESELASLRDDLDDPEGWKRLGLVYEAERLSSLAVTCYEEAVTLAPEDPELPYRLAVVHWKGGRVDEALAAIRRTIELDGEYAPAHWRLGTYLLDTGDLEGARVSFEEAQRIDPEYLGGWNGLARVELAQDEPERAIAILQRALAIDAEDAATNKLMLAAHRQAEREVAEDATMAVLASRTRLWRRDPWEREARAYRERPTVPQLGRMLREGRAEEALVILEELCEGDPDDATTLRFLGEAYIQLGRYDEALAIEFRALELEPRNIYARMALARIHEEQGDPRAAATELERVLAIEPQYTAARESLGRIFYLNGQYAMALDALNETLEYDQRSSRVHIWKGRSELELKRWKDALSSFEAALEIDTRSTEAWLGSARAKLKLGRLGQAAAALAEAQALGADPGALEPLQLALERARARRSEAQAPEDG